MLHKREFLEQVNRQSNYLFTKTIRKNTKKGQYDDYTSLRKSIKNA